MTHSSRDNTPVSVEHLAPCPICGADVTDEQGFADNFGSGPYRYASCSECTYQADLPDHRRLAGQDRGESGWIIGDDSEQRWRTWKDGAPDWTTDRDKATRYTRREDAEAVHAEDEDAWCVRPYSLSTQPPPVSAPYASLALTTDAVDAAMKGGDNSGTPVSDVREGLPAFDITTPISVDQDGALAVAVLDRFAHSAGPFTTGDAKRVIEAVQRLRQALAAVGEEAISPLEKANRLRTHYAETGQIDPGIAGAVEILQAGGIETFESCEGGLGHAYAEPTVRFHGTLSAGWKAIGVCKDFDLPVRILNRVWSLDDGEPTGPYWELVFRKQVPAAPRPIQAGEGK